MTVVLVLALAGMLAGGALPQAIARIPDRPPVEEPADDDPPTPYRVLAAAPRLALWLALATAAVWALLAVARRDSAADLPAYLTVGALGVAMAYVDLREHLLPDWLTYSALAAGAALLTVAAVATQEWGAYGRAWAGAAACLAFYLFLALLRPADLGLGDVKLAAVVGLLLGWAGWSTLVLGVFLGFLVGGVIGIVLMTAGRAGRRTSLPFGPPMLIGALLAVLLT
ncbi:prepilin peptidase [Jiangella asiatica]|uniref:Prepilin peptidase n=1 Tax=Jiangella asiatica TaxID=2530372 RepID=A0A4V2Z2N3_9ACTN|nr:A24 family peptidase [Jiangella asiatica]TDE09438.1 prepilin peptidase [Jiangella asiatica]